MAQSLRPQALERQRLFRDMSVEELAESVGVTPRAVRHWEAGTRAVGDRAFGRLLKVLRCGAQELTGRDPGTETLADLRRDAGMSTEEAASVLRRKRGAQSLYFSAEKLRDLEHGRRVRGWTWASPETLGQVARILAQIYRVPDRVVMDAWRRSRPEDPLPVLPARRARQPSGDSMAAWSSLNDRQRTYLTCIFHQDQEVEEEQRNARLAGAEQRPAAEWRRMTLALSASSAAVGYTRIQERLRGAGVHDPGAGSSVAALERRGLIALYRDRVYVDGLGDMPRTRVEMTRRGRAVARAALGVPREAGPPAPLLSLWLWKIVVRVARAGEQGVDGSLAGRGPHYLAVGQSPDGRTPSRGFIVLRHPDGVTHGPYRWFLTDSGRRHLTDHLDAYRALYPRVNTEGIDDSSA
ncbi:helix-turn-helix domain-containing protein [Streptomyces sp. TRM66268-LWL]|uniref:Helix-turn-helix domain-containing protein n=1 Tax=Streptomyces polyasparticus TaxID=2767826 RepID=A0ABR7SIQ0_9ACTN|nr:helix-turn-helix domain-containing protein [Streptomyces polyasparticus]MBC9714341.1 helix-turn-helix domain-containing protein [Streptomyces polyasparticus]